MQCYVYRSRRKPGSFLFLPIKDEFNRVPETLLKIFGTPEFSFEFELRNAESYPRKRLLSAIAAC